MAREIQPADCEAALAGIAGANTVQEHTADRGVFNKQMDGVMKSKRIHGDAAAFSNIPGEVFAQRLLSQEGKS